MILSLSLVATSLLAVELRDLQKAVRAYLAQALLLVLIIAVYAWSLPNHELYLWCLTLLVSKGIIIPYLLIRYIKSVNRQEVEPAVGFLPSLAIGLGLITVFYWLTHHFYGLLAPSAAVSGEPFRTNLAVAATILCLGLYALLTRRDAVKAVIGLCLLENGVHMSLVSLAPTIPETAMIGVATDVVVSVWMLLHIITEVYAQYSSTDTGKLSNLRG